MLRQLVSYKPATVDAMLDRNFRRQSKISKPTYSLKPVFLRVVTLWARVHFQESVISPRYLFQHPMYRVHPRKQQHYHEVRHIQGGGGPPPPPPHPLSFERNSGRSEAVQRSMEDFEKDLKSELQNFKKAVTKFSRDASEEEEDCSDNSGQ